MVPILANLGILCLQDRAALIMLCEAWADYLEAAAIVSDLGIVLSAKVGGVRKNPALAARAEAFARWKAMCLEFGLTPSARSRIQQPGKKSESKTGKGRFFESG